jgi:hypothetical protein
MTDEDAAAGAGVEDDSPDELAKTGVSIVPVLVKVVIPALTLLLKLPDSNTLPFTTLKLNPTKAAVEGTDTVVLPPFIV